MYVAIDDTYGPVGSLASTYVTSERRTYVAVEIPDDHIEEVRTGIRASLEELRATLGIEAEEFHFTDIFNRRGPWEFAPSGCNLWVFEVFAAIYRQYSWRVHVQTIDNRTFEYHPLQLPDTIDGIDLTTREGKALLFLLAKVKRSVHGKTESLVVRVDEGLGRAGSAFAPSFFGEWGDRYDGRFANSSKETPIQVADFLAFCINRSTYLQIKSARTDTDIWFLDLVANMQIVCDDLIRTSFARDFSISDVDDVHAEDRRKKGLE